MITIKVPCFPTYQKDGTKKLNHCVPSWNELLGMEHWARAKRKQEIQHAILYALRVSAADSSTRTTCAKNSLSMAADTLASYLVTPRAKPALKSVKGSPAKGKRSTRS